MTPLAIHSHYSLMRGTASPAQLCRRARKLGYRRLALTDIDNLYGLWPFLAACKREEIIPIVGAEVTDPATPRSAVCLAKTAEGYANLCRLLTARHMAKDFDLEHALPPLAGGLAVLTACPDLLLAWHGAGVDVSGAAAGRPLPPGHRLRQAAARVKAPVAAVPASFFPDPESYSIHRLLRAVAANTSLSRLNPEDCAGADAWLAGPEDYARRFAACPEAVRATEQIAEGIEFTGPDFGLVLPPWTGGQDAAGELRRRAYQGARRRYGAELSEPVVDRLEEELSIIGQMGFCSYFLIVAEIVGKSPRTCGRGSGAASLVAYCLSITNVCPIKHNLYFGRFLNPGRKDPPDIDVDFAWDERDDVQIAVLDRFSGRAAMVCNHVLFQPRMAIRETAKVFGLTEAEIGRVIRRLPSFWRMQAADGELLAEIRRRPEARETAFPEPWPQVLAAARTLLGAPRYLSVHAGGVVITPEPIETYVPIQRAAKGVPILQWEKDGTEEAGLVKIDLLGNRSLGVIRDALADIRETGGKEAAPDEARWEPEDDFATQEALAQGRTMGCFYIESPAMRLLQQKTKVGVFDHLVIHSSIIRPAANDCIQEYIRRLHGGAWDPIHPLLADVLDETFGIMVYQEDVSKAAAALAGFSPAEADALRKVLSKKDKERALADYRERFFAGARARQVAEEKIDAVWEMILSFSGYSFCKPHSASYARVSFQAAYLKVHFPAPFMAAVISNGGGFYSTFAYVSEARRLGLAILPPDVGKSRIRWQSEGPAAIRVGLSAVRDLSEAAGSRIVAEQNQRPFSGAADFFARVRPDEAEARALILCGALDRFSGDGSRPGLLWQLARWKNARGKKGGPPGFLFDSPAADLPPPPLPAEDPLARLRREFSILGFLCGRHPMALYADSLEQTGVKKARDLPALAGRRVAAAGWLITGKRVRTKKGDPMEFLTFEDDTGLVETVFFPEAYDRFAPIIEINRPYRLWGKVETDWGAATLTVEKVAPLPRLQQ
ncbi:MAG: DNA polymerase III subunit alpha [Desulfobacterales bacterium]|nr:DNA polymerase III subunit alpha [Desulfobacterales bacterium]